ncbi:MAG: UvrD-helicase domain-containing protein [Candidatus Heimdallarchaeaceae archaeon]
MLVPEKTTLICGSPGTGKTTYLLDILEKELHKVEPNEIAFVSFTRQGTYEGRDRATKKFGYTEDDFLYFRTLHSIAFRELKMRPGEMINRKHYNALSEALNMKIKGYYDYNLIENDDLYLFYIDLYRNNKSRANQIVDNINMQKLIWIEKNYRELKKYYGIKDFTDLIIEFIQREKSLPVKVAIIDEAQDLTSLQWEMIEIAFKNCERIYVAGDDDQSIYEWSGADVKYFLSIEGKIKILSQSYRLPKNILKFATSITNKIKERITKDFEPTEEEGHVLSINDIRDVKLNENESYLFLSRNNMFLPMFKDYLMQQSVVFKYQNKPVINTEHIIAINTYVRIQKEKEYSKKDLTVLKRYLFPNINLSRIKNIEWYDALKINNDQMIYYRDLLRKHTDISKCNINVSTIHSVKGSEADNVILYLNVTRSVYKNIQINPDSEHRVFYVGATRAKKNLYILLPDQKYYYDIL